MFIPRSPSFSPAAKFLILFFFFSVFTPMSCLDFNYPKFLSDNRDDFIFADEIHSNIYQEALQITRDTSNPDFTLENSSGRIVYLKLFKLWRDNRSFIASFNTTFTLNISPQRGKEDEPMGEGLAFIITSSKTLPSNSYGQWLGIVNEVTNGSQQNQIIAIEFDTRKNHDEDIDDNHMGLNVNGINSREQFPMGGWGINLSSANNVTVNIQYSGSSKNMTIDLSMVDKQGQNHSTPSIPLHIDLSQYLPEDVYVGFSGSTGNYTQLNCVTSWSFSGEDITKSNNMPLIIWVLPGILLPLFCSGLIFYIWWRRKHQCDHGGLNVESMLNNSTKGPHRFRFKELKSATANFSPKNKLGQGGFGTVYRGFLKKINQDVAVKRVSKYSSQGEQEFVAEVKTISHLRHKNLVKLIGWCYERAELLLVYEFLPKGSLDKLLFFKEKSLQMEILLNWERRHRIIYGVASALNYLHEECEKRIFHRDVKASNVMLDSEYNARLGDFGLARMIQHDSETHHSTSVIAGTPGYIAPEYFLTNRASVETDVYGFGIFTMEVASGRNPGNNNNMVDWLWDLYGKQRIIDAADPQLQGMYDKEQIESVLKLGLACCHSNPNERPTMRAVLQVLKGESPPPILPNQKPTFMWPALPENLSLYTE